MKVCRVLAVLALALAVLAGCPTVPKGKPVEAINNSDVYRLVQEALQPVADQFVDRGDRILLVPFDAFYGTREWRFVPIPMEIPQKDFDEKIASAVSKLSPASPNMGGAERESKLVNDAFERDGSKEVVRLRTSSEAWNELLLGRILTAGGYSGVAPFSLAEYARRNPYFVDSFEGGMLGAVLKRQGKGFERLENAGIDGTAMAQHRKGELVFGTDMLAFSSWKDLQKKYSATKLLAYSVNNVVDDGMSWIGIQASFRLVDIAHGGRVLWSGTRTATSSQFPKDKIPALGGLRLTLPPEVTGARRDAWARTLKAQGVAAQSSAILMKIDDIPVFGTYPVTREDFAVEEALTGLFGSMPGLTVVDKLQKRLYKLPWQMAHSVHYIDPMLGGDFTEFQSFYGARYMIGYRVMWKQLQGVQVLQGTADLELADKILGIYVKVLDMGDGGKTLLSDFVPFVAETDLGKNILYRCYNATRGLATVASALKDSGVLSEDTHTVLVNRRMEIANTYIGEATATEKFILNRMPAGDVPALFRSYYDVYEVIRTLGLPAEKKTDTAQKDGEEPPFDQVQEMNLEMAVALMQSWFEDGLCSALAAADISPSEKLDSLYSRYFLTLQGDMPSAGDDLPFLSPILLGKWGPTMKTYYNIDKIVYFSLLETGMPASYALRTPSTVPLARFFPFVTSETDSLQVSVVNVTSGDYEFKKDFALK